MVCKNLEIAQKTSKIYEIYFKENGISVDITDWTIYFIVKERMDDADTGALIDKEVTSHTNAVQGKTQIELTSSDTNITPGNYYYSIDYLKYFYKKIRQFKEAIRQYCRIACFK